MLYKAHGKENGDDYNRVNMKTSENGKIAKNRTASCIEEYSCLEGGHNSICAVGVSWFERRKSAGVHLPQQGACPCGSCSPKVGYLYLEKYDPTYANPLELLRSAPDSLLVVSRQ